jgi:hypothetical protein
MSCKGRHVGGGDEGVLSRHKEMLELVREGGRWELRIKEGDSLRDALTDHGGRCLFG